MDLNKISNFIKTKRKELGLTQEELAEKLFITEKAISRWETGRGTPDISLLIPLSKELKIEVYELLNGEEQKKNSNEVEQVIRYNEIRKKRKNNFLFKIIICCYILSILFFLIYLRVEYDPNIELNYFIRIIDENNYIEKIEDKKKNTKLSQIIVSIYYTILLFNMVIFARYNIINSYNIIPFKSIIEICSKGNLYTIIINIFGNILIFMPLEYFIIELFKVEKGSLNFLISFFIILTIEIVQFIFKVGVLDIDDLILCTMGMMIFYKLYNKRKTFSR